MSGDIASPAWRPLDKRVKKLWAGNALLAPIPFLFFAAIPVGVFVAQGKAPAWVLWAIVGFSVLMIVVTLALINARYESYRYRITDEDVAVRSGILFRSKRYVPRHRIQHVDIHAGPWARKLGLSEIHIYVAGGTAMTIPGLDELEAEKIRQHLLRSIAPVDAPPVLAP